MLGMKPARSSTRLRGAERSAGAGETAAIVRRLSGPLRSAYRRRELPLSRRDRGARPFRGGGLGVRRLHQQDRSRPASSCRRWASPTVPCHRRAGRSSTQARPRVLRATSRRPAAGSRARSDHGGSRTDIDTARNLACRSSRWISAIRTPGHELFEPGDFAFSTRCGRPLRRLRLDGRIPARLNPARRPQRPGGRVTQRETLPFAREGLEGSIPVAPTIQTTEDLIVSSVSRSPPGSSTGRASQKLTLTAVAGGLTPPPPSAGAQTRSRWWRCDLRPSDFASMSARSADRNRSFRSAGALDARASDADGQAGGFRLGHDRRAGAEGERALGTKGVRVARLGPVSSATNSSPP